VSIVRWLALIAFIPFAARAAGNDLQLWRLGHPDPLLCTACDGSPGDVSEPGDPQAQTRFHRLASTLGLAFVPPFQETAGTLGQSGFEVGASSSEAFPRISADSWATSQPPPKVLSLPTVVVRKGLGGSLELGAAVSWLMDSQMMALSAELRWALIDGVAYAPDLALRAYGTRVTGTQELDLALAGADAMLSKSFGVAGAIKLQPYGSFGMAMINAQSGVVNFKPAAQDAAHPSFADGVFRSISLFDNRFLRGTAGLRLVAGAVVLGVEGSVAAGTNAVQYDNLAGGAPPPTEYVRLWSVSGRLGVGF